MTLLIEDLARLPGPVTLVVDDFHRVTSPRVLEGVGLLAERLPPGLSVVVAARQDPELPLARLRGAGKLAEIRAGQLRFSKAEAEALLSHSLGLTLPPEEVHALWRRTESRGWRRCCTGGPRPGTGQHGTAAVAVEHALAAGDWSDARDGYPQGPWPGGPASVESAVRLCRALLRLLDGDLAAADPASRRAAELELESGTAG